MKQVNNIPLFVWAGMLAAACSALGTPPVVFTADRGVVAVVAVPCKFPRRKRIKVEDRGINPETFGKIYQQSGKQKWNKKRK